MGWTHRPHVASDGSSGLRQRANRGEASAIARLIELQVEPLRRWAHRKLPAWARSVSDTADLVQDAIIRTLTRFDAIDVSERGAIGAYLRQAISNRIADEFRRVERRGIPSALPESLASGVTPFDHAAADELERRYKRALMTLKEADRHLVVGHIELEYSIEQLACAAGKSFHATRMALRRALMRLASEMDRRG